MTEPRIIRDIRYAIDHDSWMWIVCHGEPRCGKSTLCMDITKPFYRSADKVLGSIVYNLSQLLYKIKRGLPERWPVVIPGINRMRVPLLIWDDFAVHSGKAKTQHEKAWDIFKGGFDALGTKVAVIIANMVSASSPTAQLMEKFTHELWIDYRGHYKYDEVKNVQDFYGFRNRVHKTWLDEGFFDPLPSDVYEQYDEMRCSLADEVIQSVEDTLVDTHIDTLIKRVLPMDVQLLKWIRRVGPVYNQQVKNELGDLGKEAIRRCKARQLIVSIPVGNHYYKHDLTPLGIELLNEVTKPTPNLSTSPTFIH